MHTQSPAELLEWVDKLTQAQESDGAAKRAVKADKAARKSVFARVVDALSSTPAEKAATAATDSLATVRRQALEAASKWIVSTAQAELTSSPDAAAQHKAQFERMAAAQTRHGQAFRWKRLAENARDSLENARSACSSASSMELLDAISTNKTFSVLSTVETSSASDAVRSARAAVNELAEALPKRAEVPDVETPDDFLDFVVDMTFAPAFDVLSWFNMGALDDAARKCDRAAAGLEPLVNRLIELAQKARDKADAEAAALRAIEAPFLQRAADRVPHMIGAPVPDSFN